jgi:hypothetical protein
MRGLLVVAGMWLVGCGGSAKTVTNAAGPPPREPACKGTVKFVEDTGVAKLLVGAVEIAEITAEHARDAKAVSWPLGPRSILLTWEAPGHYGAYDGGSELWEIDCDAPKKRSFLAIEGANFGASAMTRDGKTLYFSGPTYVRALDVATKTVRVVSKPGKSSGCWVAPSPEEGYQLVDTVIGLDELDDVLVVSRGGPCGFEGDYEGTTMLVDHPAAPRGERQARPTTSIAVDAGGGWWVASDRALWWTGDGGVTWRKAALPDGGEYAPPSGGPGAILPDPRRPGHVVVQTVVTYGYGPSSGGHLYRTGDAGVAWEAVPLPDDLHRPHESVDLAVEVKSSTEHLVVWGRASDAATESETLDVAWETTDGGATWKRVPPPHPAVVQSGVKLEAKTAKGVVLKTSRDGLLVTEPGAARPRRIYPH